MLGFIVCFALAAGAGLAGIRGGLDAGRVQAGDTVLDVMQPIQAKLRALADPPESPGLQRVAFLGDSTVGLYPPGRTVPERLQQELSAAGDGAPATQVYTFAGRGMTPFDHYFLADRVAGVAPDLVLMVFNLFSLTGSALDGTRAQLSGWISPSRLPEALSLPLHRVGLSLDRLLFHLGIVHAGVDGLWWRVMREQVRTKRARLILEKWVAEVADHHAERDFVAALGRTRMERMAEAAGVRPGRALTREMYAEALEGVDPDHAALRILAATLGEFRRAGVRVLIYLAPNDVEEQAGLGPGENEGLERSIAAVLRVVRENGGEFVVFRDLFPTGSFRDRSGHLRVDPAFDGPVRLARALAPRVLAALESDGERGD